MTEIVTKNSNWHSTKLGDLVDIFDSKRIPLSSAERSKKKGTYPYYGASNIVDYVDDYLFDGEYLLVSEDGENLKTRNTPIAFLAKGKFWVNNHAHILRGKKEHLTKYLCWYFSQLDISPFLTGAVQPKLSKKNLEAIKINLPIDDIEQKTIVDFLSSIDNKIEALQSQNIKLEEIAQKVLREWFLNYNFPDISGRPYKKSGGKMKLESDLEIPQHWKLHELRDVFAFIKGKKPEIVSPTSVEGFMPQILIEVFDGGVPSYANPKGLITAEAEDIIMVMDGASSGRLEFGFAGIIGSTLSVLKCSDNVRSILYFFLKIQERDIRSKTTGSAIPHTDKERIYRLQIALPESNSEFAMFDNYFSIIRKKIAHNRKMISTLRNIKNKTLPRLMRGQVKLLT